MRLSTCRPAAALLAGVLLAGCSGGSDGSDAGGVSIDRLQPAAAVREAVDTTAEAGSSKVALVSTTMLGDREVVFSGEGAFDAAAGLGELNFTLPDGAGTIEQRIVGDSIYLTLPQQPGVFFELAVADVAGTSLGNSTDPTAALGGLRAVSDDVEEVGTVDVRGESTTHYRGTFDAQAAVDAAEGLSAEILRGSLGAAELGQVAFDAYLDDQGRLRKLEQVIEVPPSEATMGQPVSSRIVVELFEFGTEVAVEAPPAEQVQDGAPLLDALRMGAGG